MDSDDKLCPEPTWSEALKTMSGPLLQNLLSFNKDSINEEMVELMDPYLRMEDYSFEAAKKACGNVAISVFAGNVSQRPVADFRGSRGTAACAVRCRRTAFCTVMLFTGECDACFRLNRPPPDRT